MTSPPALLPRPLLLRPARPDRAGLQGVVPVPVEPGPGRLRADEANPGSSAATSWAADCAVDGEPAEFGPPAGAPGTDPAAGPARCPARPARASPRSRSRPTTPTPRRSASPEPLQPGTRLGERSPGRCSSGAARRASLGGPRAPLARDQLPRLLVPARYSFSRYCTFRTETPRSVAARDVDPPQRSRARRIASRSISSMEAPATGNGACSRPPGHPGPAAAGPRGRCRARGQPPPRVGWRAPARARCRATRARRWPRARPGATARTSLPSARFASATKCATSAGRSSRRARRGGSAADTTASR